MKRAGVSDLYAGWHLANEGLVAAIAPLTAEQLALPVGREGPLWGSVAHLAGTRVYWLCHVFGEPGLERTPFPDGVADKGWEDDLTRPRRADELVEALNSSWRIAEHALETWTPDTLQREARRMRDGRAQVHTRQSVLMRMITHDAFHIGEISLTLGAHGLGGTSPNGPIDLWAGLGRWAD
ncbi:MAG TPA: DinB family protein [Candidatus Thermoplasmatota archaeon]|nr:DinB family protein [Candidatus Thermoplasmatota archaeon]